MPLQIRINYYSTEMSAGENVITVKDPRSLLVLVSHHYYCSRQKKIYSQRWHDIISGENPEMTLHPWRNHWNSYDKTIQFLVIPRAA